ncbi:MAG TPA: ferric reductase-like transmembrane domain-containing protein [Acidimicrobiia bacterium]|nr:ferric reductase-like transmembrane domain-containing protein [Acidimicrobiia bacterium]
MWWYAARSAGIVAWALLAGSVVWGLLLSTKVLGKRPRPNWLLDLHRYLGGLGVVFTGVHVGAILLDQFVKFTPVNVLVPFTGTWHPGAVAWGIVAMYLLLAVEITSLLRNRLSKRAWRMTHFLSFPLFGMATIHALTAGSDRHTFVLRALILIGTLSVIALTAIRVWYLDDEPTPRDPSGRTQRSLKSSRQPALARVPVIDRGSR